MAKLNQMKKFTATMIILITFAVFCTSAALAAAPTYRVPASAYTDEEGLASFEINVSIAGVYAGAQFELILDNGITIERVSFNKGGGAGVLPPTFARGSYYFSLIAGGNNYDGDLVCTVRISYTGKEPAEITVAGIQSHFVNSPGNVTTYTNSSRSTILVIPYEPPAAPSPAPPFTPSPAPPFTPLPAPSFTPPLTPPLDDDGNLDEITQTLGGQTTSGIGLDEIELDDIDMLPEFDIDISSDPEEIIAVPEEGAVDDEVTTEFADSGDDQIPLAELLGERYLTWIWIIVATFISAVVASVFSEIKHHRDLKLKAAAEGAATGTAESAETGTVEGATECASTDTTEGTSTITAEGAASDTTKDATTNNADDTTNNTENKQ